MPQEIVSEVRNRVSLMPLTASMTLTNSEDDVRPERRFGSLALNSYKSGPAVPSFAGAIDRLGHARDRRHTKPSFDRVAEPLAAWLAASGIVEGALFPSLMGRIGPGLSPGDGRGDRPATDSPRCSRGILQDIACARNL